MLEVPHTTIFPAEAGLNPPQRDQGFGSIVKAGQSLACRADDSMCEGRARAGSLGRWLIPIWNSAQPPKMAEKWAGYADI